MGGFPQFLLVERKLFYHFFFLLFTFPDPSSTFANSMGLVTFIGDGKIPSV
jgi:hypothetical protein